VLKARGGRRLNPEKREGRAWPAPTSRGRRAVRSALRCNQGGRAALAEWEGCNALRHRLARSEGEGDGSRELKGEAAGGGFGGVGEGVTDDGDDDAQAAGVDRDFDGSTGFVRLAVGVDEAGGRTFDGEA